MSLPYTVKVTSHNSEIQVTVHPKPVATKEQYLPVVSKRFQSILTDDRIRNTLTGRANLKKRILEALEDFHNQGMIKPKEDE